MIVDKSLMVQLRKEAREHWGGTKIVLEVQTWNGLIDSDGIDDDSDIDNFDLVEGVELPDDAKSIDVQVYGNHNGYEGDKIGWLYVSIKSGKIEAVRV